MYDVVNPGTNQELMDKFDTNKYIILIFREQYLHLIHKSKYLFYLLFFLKMLQSVIIQQKFAYCYPPIFFTKKQKKSQSTWVFRLWVPNTQDLRITQGPPPPPPIFQPSQKVQEWLLAQTYL